VVAIHGKGDFFGEGSLNGQSVRLASAVAMADSTIMRITKAAIVRVLHEQPKFAETFMAHLLARNARVEEDLVDQLFNSSEKRLARALFLMANFGKDETPAAPVIAKISQETLVRGSNDSNGPSPFSCRRRNGEQDRQRITLGGRIESSRPDR
jgi:CRP/FNR family transcriptional regulator, cyclic AMP receptor protein